MFRRQICPKCSKSKVGFLELFEGIFSKDAVLNRSFVGGSIGKAAVDHEPLRKICSCGDLCIVCKRSIVHWNSWSRICPRCKSKDIEVSEVEAVKVSLFKIFAELESKDSLQLFLNRFEKPVEREFLQGVYRLWKRGLEVL